MHQRTSSFRVVISGLRKHFRGSSVRGRFNVWNQTPPPLCRPECSPSTVLLRPDPTPLCRPSVVSPLHGPLTAGRTLSSFSLLHLLRHIPQIPKKKAFLPPVTSLPGGVRGALKQSQRERTRWHHLKRARGTVLKLNRGSERSQDPDLGQSPDQRFPSHDSEETMIRRDQDVQPS